MKPVFAAFALAVGLGAETSALAATPVPIDLSTWSEKGPPGNGNWVVGGGGAFVNQTINGDPTFFVSPNSFINTNIQGSFRVGADGDNDYIGFVFGYQSPAGNVASSTDFNFLLFDWKQGNQDIATEGFNVTRINQNTTNYTPCFWGHTDNNTTCDVLGTRYGAGQGWVDNTDYTFDLLFRTDRITIEIGGGAFGAGTEIFDIAGNFAAGQFGFYNYSQSGVTYTGFTEQAAPPPSSSVPEPGSLALLGLGLGALALRRRRKQ